MDMDISDKQREVSEMMRQIGRDTGIPLVATEDAHYVSPQDAIDQQIPIITVVYEEE